MASRWIIATMIGLLVVGVLVGPRSTTMAQSAGLDSSKVAVIDMTKAFNDCKQTAALNEYLTKSDADFKTKLDEMGERMKEKQAELEAFARGSKEYTERFKQSVQLQIERNTAVRLHQREVVRDRAHWTRTTYQKIVDTVENVAKARGVVLVLYHDQMDLRTDDPRELDTRLRGRKVIYAASGLDITQEVIDALNRDFEASGGLKLPQSQ